MRKLALLALCVGAFLAVPGIAASKTIIPGTLSGSATVTGSTVAIGGIRADPFSPYDGLENDLSGTCNVDIRGTNTIIVGSTTYNVVCAHYVASSGCCNAGSQKMRFTYQVGPSNYAVVRITDNGDLPDTFAIGNTTSFANALAWLNKGAQGCHCGATWTFLNMTSGDFVITAPYWT